MALSMFRRRTRWMYPDFVKGEIVKPRACILFHDRDYDSKDSALLYLSDTCLSWIPRKENGDRFGFDPQVTGGDKYRSNALFKQESDGYRFICGLKKSTMTVHSDSFAIHAVDNLRVPSSLTDEIAALPKVHLLILHSDQVLYGIPDATVQVESIDDLPGIDVELNQPTSLSSLMNNLLPQLNSRFFL